MVKASRVRKGLSEFAIYLPAIIGFLFVVYFLLLQFSIRTTNISTEKISADTKLEEIILNTKSDVATLNENIVSVIQSHGGTDNVKAEIELLREYISENQNKFTSDVADLLDDYSKLLDQYSGYILYSDQHSSINSCFSSINLKKSNTEIINKSQKCLTDLAYLQLTHKASPHYSVLNKTSKYLSSLQAYWETIVKFHKYIENGKTELAKGLEEKLDTEYALILKFQSRYRTEIYNVYLGSIVESVEQKFSSVISY